MFTITFSDTQSLQNCDVIIEMNDQTYIAFIPFLLRKCKAEIVAMKDDNSEGITNF